MPADAAPTLGERYHRVLADIDSAAVEAGRDPSEITTVVVTKFHPTAIVRELVALGARDLGENRHQEAAQKAAETDDLDIRWHFVGQLQTNKAAAVLEYAHIIHSVDRPTLVDAIARTKRDVEIFLQLNLTRDSNRGGVAPEDLEPLVELVLSSPTMTLRGVMAVAPRGEDPRTAFRRVRELSERVQGLAPGATALSMGMSGDYREAILEGATHLRIGTAITGNRQVQG